MRSFLIKEEKFFIDNQSKKSGRIVGLILCIITLPYIIISGILYSFFYWTELFNTIFRIDFLFIVFIIFFVGLSLVFFLIQPKYQGLYLITLGYTLFFLSFLFLPPINYTQNRLISLFLIGIDLPFIFMVFSGVLLSFTHFKNPLIYKLNFIGILISSYFSLYIYIGSIIASPELPF